MDGLMDGIEWMDGYNAIDSVVSYHRDGRGREWGQCGGERMKRKVFN